MIVLWTLAATIGALIALWNLLDARRDFLALDPALVNGRRIIARGWLLREGIRFGIQTTWALVGLGIIVQVYLPIAELLVGTAVALALNTVLDARERRTVRRIIGGG